jgi:hypothetical protein
VAACGRLRAGPRVGASAWPRGGWPGAEHGAEPGAGGGLSVCGI